MAAEDKDEKNGKVSRNGKAKVFDQFIFIKVGGSSHIMYEFTSKWAPFSVNDISSSAPRTENHIKVPLRPESWIGTVLMLFGMQKRRSFSDRKTRMFHWNLVAPLPHSEVAWMSRETFGWLLTRSSVHQTCVHEKIINLAVEALFSHTCRQKWWSNESDSTWKGERKVLEFIGIPEFSPGSDISSWKRKVLRFNGSEMLQKIVQIRRWIWLWTDVPSMTDAMWMTKDQKRLSNHSSPIDTPHHPSPPCEIILINIIDISFAQYCFELIGIWNFCN